MDTNQADINRTNPKNGLSITFFATLFAGLCGEIICLLTSKSSLHALGFLPPLVFLCFMVVLLIFLFIVFAKNKILFQRIVSFFIAPRTCWKDFLFFIVEQGIAFLFCYGLFSQGFGGVGQGGDPYGIAFLIAGLTFCLLFFYPLFWGLEEHEEDSPILGSHVKFLPLILYRVLFLTLSSAFSGLSLYFSIVNLMFFSGDSLIAPILSSLFFSASLVLGIVFLKKNRFESVFAYFAYSTTLWKNLFLALAGFPFGISIFYIEQNWSHIWYHAAMPAIAGVDALFLLFGVLPLLLLRYPYSKRVKAFSKR